MSSARYNLPRPTGGPNERRNLDHILKLLRELQRTIGNVFFNLEAYGAVSNGTAGVDEALADADAAASANGGVLLIGPGTFLLKSNYTLLSPTLVAGGTIKIASGATLTADVSLLSLSGEWVDTSLGGSVVRPQTSSIRGGFVVQDGDLSVEDNMYASKNASYTTAWDGFVARLSGTAVTGSGSVGMQFNRDPNNGQKAMGISYMQDEDEKWSHGLDADTTNSHPDFFLHQANVGDFLRIADTGQFRIGYGVGPADAASAILALANVAGHSLASMLQFDAIEQDASITRLIRSVNNGVDVFSVDPTGRLGVGVDFSSSFGLKVKGSWLCHLGLDSAPSDGSLENNSVVFYTDGTDLLVKWKNGSGTVKTGTITTS